MSQEKATIIIGKSGATDTVIEEIKNQIKTKKCVKISLPQAMDDKDALAQDICSRIGAECIDLRGRKLIIYKD